MGFINESVSSMSDFISKLDTFLVSEGWTSDELNLAGGEWAISRGTIFLQARWDTGTPNYLGIYHSLGFISTATLPGNQTDDSGNGAISGTDATLQTQRGTFITNTPVQYWAFTSTGAPHYFHIVVQQDSNPDFLHFGSGLLDKIGDWTGGEYAYGHRQQTGFTNSVAILPGSSILLDGLSADAGAPQPSNMEEYVATVHVEGLPNQVGGGSGKWGVTMGNQGGANLGTDRAAVARNRLIGGFRGSMIARAFGRFAATGVEGLIPMYPIAVWYEDVTNVTVVLPVLMLLGYQQDVRGVSIENFVGGDIVDIGGDDWYLFPTQRKFISGALTNTSGYQGIAYRRI